MPPVDIIISPRDPRIEFFVELRGHVVRLDEHNLILVEGDQQVLRLLQSDFALDTLFFEQRFYERFAETLNARDLSGVRCYAAERDVMEQIVGYRLHQGVMALAKRPTPVELDSLESPVVVLQGLTDPENVGSIVRSCRAFGVSSILCDPTTSDPYLRRAIRVSMGAILPMKVSYSSSLANDLKRLSSKMRICAVEKCPGSVSVDTVDLSLPSAFILGNERTGIAKEVLAVCDTILEIPMAECELGSINVAAAASIVLSRSYLARCNNGAK